MRSGRNLLVYQNENGVLYCATSNRISYGTIILIARTPHSRLDRITLNHRQDDFIISYVFLLLILLLWLILNEQCQVFHGTNARAQFYIALCEWQFRNRRIDSFLKYKIIWIYLSTLSRKYEHSKKFISTNLFADWDRRLLAGFRSFASDEITTRGFFSNFDLCVQSAVARPKLKFGPPRIVKCRRINTK